MELIAPFARAVLNGGDDDGSALVSKWAQPLGWLVCKCDDRPAAQREVLRACCEALAGARIDSAAAVCKALWDADVVGEEVLLEWFGSLGAADRERRFVEPLARWLQTTEIEQS